MQGLLETDVDGGDGWDEVLCHGCSSVIQLLRRSDLLSCHQCLCQTHYHYCLAKGRDLDRLRDPASHQSYDGRCQDLPEPQDQTNVSGLGVELEDLISFPCSQFGQQV